MTIDYDYFGDPPILYTRWTGNILGQDILNAQTQALNDRLIRHTSCDLCDWSGVTSIDVEPEPLHRAGVRRDARRPDPNWAVLKVLLVPDARFLSFARLLQRSISEQSHDRVEIVSEQAAALALAGRSETTLAEFLANAGPALPKGP